MSSLPTPFAAGTRLTRIANRRGMMRLNVDASAHTGTPTPAQQAISGSPAPLALLVRTPFVLAVNPALRITSVADLVARAKSAPDTLAFASGGPGTPHHLFAELFQTLTGTRLTHVPYKRCPACVPAC